MEYYSSSHIIRLYGKRRRNRRPLKQMRLGRLLALHDYFIQTPSGRVVRGMNLDRGMVGPGVTAESLEQLIPCRRLVEKEMKTRGLLIDRGRRQKNPVKAFFVYLLRK